MKSFTGQALRWEWRDGIIELTLDRAPGNEIGTAMLAELEQARDADYVITASGDRLARRGVDFVAIDDDSDMDAIRENALLNGRVRLLQPERGYRAGLDAVRRFRQRHRHLGKDIGAGAHILGLELRAAAAAVD